MKKCSLIIGLLMVASAIVWATEADLTQRQVRDPKQLSVILDVRTIVQPDSAATNTTITSYTPSRVGQLLTGKVSETGAVWVAVGLTSNDWIKVSN